MIVEAVEKIISEMRRTRMAIEDAETQLASARAAYDVMQKQFSELIKDIKNKVSSVTK